MKGKITIQLDGSGRGRLWLNDVEISSAVSAIELESKVGELPLVSLTVHSDDLRAHLSEAEIIVVEAFRRQIPEPSINGPAHPIELHDELLLQEPGVPPTSKGSL